MKITSKQFDDKLLELLEETTPAALLTIPGIYEPLAEEFNNEILRRLEAEQEEEEDDHGDKLLTEQDVAKRLQLSVRTLQAWRRTHQGPPWFKLSPRAVRYRSMELETWIDSQQQNGGSEK